MIFLFERGDDQGESIFYERSIVFYSIQDVKNVQSHLR